jgi:hypothetical protein
MEESETKSEDQISESELVPAIQLIVKLRMARADTFGQDELNRTEECFVGVWSTVGQLDDCLVWSMLKVKKGGGNTYVCKRKC